MLIDQQCVVYWPRTRRKLKTCTTCKRLFEIVINRRRYGGDRGQHQRKYCSDACRREARQKGQTE